VRVISKSPSREFWNSRTNDSELAKRDLSTRHKLAEKADWNNFGDLKQSFGSADRVGNCVVFDAGKNRYRIVARMKYKQGKLFVLAVMDHAEHDKQKWVDDCGCRRPAPKRQSTHKKTR
jgi:mRNA interferase HigB